MFSNKRKLIGFILGLILFSITVTSLTYAYYSWQSSNTNITFNINDQYFYCETDIDSSVSNLSPVLDYKDGTLYKFKVNNIANGTDPIDFSITMNISSISDVLKDASFKYKLMVDKTNGSNNCQTGASGCEEVANGNFSNVHVGNNNLVPSINLPNNSRYEYYFFIYIDGTMSNPSGMQSASMVSTLGVCDIYVTFDTTEGDTAVTPLYKKVIEGDTYGNLPTPVRNDAIVTYNYNNATGGNSVASDTVSFTFGGWYKEQALTNQVTSSTTVTSSVNHKLYPKWTASKTITLPTPTKVGNTFGGWYSDSTLTTKVGDGGSSYNPSKSTPLYAKWTPITYTITYKDCGDTTFSGTHGNNYPQNYTYGVGATLDSPTKANNIFAGYYSNSTCTGNDVTSIGTSETENKIFYAKWDPVYYLNTSTNTYYITLAEALSAVASNQTIKAIGNAVETSNATLSSSKTGVKLDLNGKTITMGSYYIDNKGTLDIYNSNSNAAILQGTYIDGVIKNTGTLTTNGTSTTNALTIQNTSDENGSRVIYNDVSGVLTLNTNSTITYITPAALTSGIRLLVELYGTLIVNGANLTNTITGKTNVDWGIYLGNANARMEMISGNLTTYGRSMSNEYGTGTTTPAVEISGGTVSSTKSSAIYNFTSGTIKISGGTITTGSTGITNSSTGTIKLIGGSITAGTHVVYNGSTGIVDMTGGTHTGLVGLSNNSTGTVKITGGSITASKSGIYNNSTGTVIIGEDDGTVSTSIPFIKSTNANGGSSAVQMNNSGGTLNFYDGKITSDNGAGYALNSIADSIVNTPTGYVVRKTVVDGVEIADLAPLRTITYKDCGNTTFSGTHVSGYPTTYIEGIGVTLDIPTKTGYTFGGYYSSSACSGTAVTNISSGDSGNKTFYAKWQNNVNELAFNSSGGDNFNEEFRSAVYDVANLYNEQMAWGLNYLDDDISAFAPYIESVPIPIRDGFSFDGWYTTASGGTKILNADGTFTGTAVDGYTGTSTWKLTQDRTLYAHWTVNSYTINYNYNGGSCSPTPTTANYDEVVSACNTSRSKTFTVTLNLNGTGATQSANSVSKAQAWSGISSSTSSGLMSGALTGSSTSAVNTSWNGSNTSNYYFKNLRSSSGTVTMILNWTAVNITLPTITKTGYTCGYAESNTATTIQYASGGTYTPSTTTNSKTLYAVCKPNNYNITYANNYTGTSYNGLSWSGDAITFDGVDDYVNLGQINSEYATYAVKFMATNLNGTQQQLIGNEHVGGGGLIINTSNRLVGEFYIDGQYRQVASSVVLSANTQYSAAVTYNGSTIRLYLNGVETGTAINYTGKISLTRGTNDNGPTMMFLGANPQGNIGEAYYFKGKIYSAKVYNRALSSTEIANNYNGTSTAYDGAVKIISSSLTNLNQVIYSKTYGGTLGTQFTPNRPGYTFAGWYTAASGGTQVTSSTAVPAANTTYYAHWTAAPAVPIRFLGVGGIYNQWNSITGKYSALYNSGTSHGTESTWWDLSGTGNTGTANNITWGADYAQFNGTSSYVSLKAQNSSQATLMVTFSTASASTDQYIFGNWHAGGGGIRISSGKILGEFYIQSDWRTVNTGVSVVANKIYSVALSYDGSTVKVYVDGISKGTPVSITGSIGAPTNSTVMMMGCNPNGTTCEAKYFNGKIYEAAVMNDDLGDQMTGYNYGRTTTYDDNISVPNGARQGFDFAGWYDASSGGNRVYSNELFRKTGVSDLLLYARWTQILANGTFYIKPASNSNLCVEATNNATADNTLLRLYGCSSSRLGQKWRVTQMGDGYVNISNYRDTNNGNNSRITIKDTTPANGKSIVLYTWSGGFQQRWLGKAEGNGYQLINANGRNFAIHAINDSITSGTNLELRTPGTTNGFIWTFVPWS